MAFEAGGLSLLIPEPQKAVIVDTSRTEDDPLRAVQVLLNPNEFGIGAHAEYTKLDIPGMSQQVAQWSHSTNSEYTVQVYWSAMEQARVQAFWGLRNGSTVVDAGFYIWLMSLTKPIGPGRAPPQIQFYWPGFMWIAGNVTDVKTKITQWAQHGMPMLYTCDIEFFEEERRFVTSRRYLQERQSVPYGGDAASPPVGRLPRRYG